MKRILTEAEVILLIQQEDEGGVCNCLQDIFAFKEPVDVIGDFDEAGNLETYEVKAKRK